MESDNSNSPKPSLSRNHRRERAVEGALRGLVVAYLSDAYPDLVLAEMDLPLNLQLTFRAGEPGELRFEPDLRDQIREQAEALLRPLDSYQPGAVYDFQAESAEARACRPPTARSIFEGYDPMGRPTWTSFDEWRETGLGDGHLSVRLQTGKELKERQLDAYGKNSPLYHVLGQACLGYVSVPPRLENLIEDDRLALTVQVVEIRDSRGHFDLILNVLVGRLTPGEVDTLLREPSCQIVLLALRKLEEDLFRLRDRALRAWKDRNEEALRQVIQRIPGLLTRFSRAVTLDPKPAREVPYPVLDVQVADLGDLFFDRERDSWVLLGSKQRAYVLDGEGDLLTTFQATEDRVNLRLDSGRWRPAVEEEIGYLGLLKTRANEIVEGLDA